MRDDFAKLHHQWRKSYPFTLPMGHQGDLQRTATGLANGLYPTFGAGGTGATCVSTQIPPGTITTNQIPKPIITVRMCNESGSEQRENLLLITGHTHQPVFKSLTQLGELIC